MFVTRRRFVSLTPFVASGVREAFAAGPQSVGPAAAATSFKQVNGVACASDGRVFASLPRWIDDETFSVGLRQADGSLIPYPGSHWNTWRAGMAPTERLICVNAVHADPRQPDVLWIVDAAAPAFGDIIPGGPKLIAIKLSTNQVIRSYSFGTEIVPMKGYLNDVRLARDHAFLTESGTGAIIVLDLNTGKARRVLENHESTKAVPGRLVVVDGRRLATPSGRSPQINVDGIELSPDRQWLLYAVPFGGWLWRVPVASLLEQSLTTADLENHVQKIGPLMPIGGMTAASDGGLLLSDVEHHSIVHRGTDGTLTPIVESLLLQWPDASALDRSGDLWVAASQVNHLPSFNGGVNMVSRPFHLLKVEIPTLPRKRSEF